MSFAASQRQRTALFLTIAGLIVTAAAVSAVSARDPDGVSLRVGMVMITAGAALWLPWQALLPAVLLVWLGPNYGRALVEDSTLFNYSMMLELPGLLGLGAFSGLARLTLRRLEEQDLLWASTSEEYSGVDPETGVYEERHLRPAVNSELARSRRFNRPFALVLVGIDEMRQRFDYRDEESWTASFTATANLLRSTRNHIDRAYRYGPSSFALILPESGEREVRGLVRRLRGVSRRAQPAEGEHGGPLPTHFGATFFPTRATTTEDLIRRAEIALRVAQKSSSRVQIDGAEAPDLEPMETLRRGADEMAASGLMAETETAATDQGTEVSLPTNEPDALPAPALAAVEPAVTSMVADLVAPKVALEVVGEPALAPANGAASDSAAKVTVIPDRFAITVSAQQSDAAATRIMPLEPPTLVSSFEAKRALAPADDSVNDLMKRMDETLALIRSLRSDKAS